MSAFLRLRSSPFRLALRADRLLVAVVLISIVGTLITGQLVENYGVSLPTSTTIFALALARRSPLVRERADPVDSHHRHEQREASTG